MSNFFNSKLLWGTSPDSEEVPNTDALKTPTGRISLSVRGSEYRRTQNPCQTCLPIRKRFQMLTRSKLFCWTVLPLGIFILFGGNRAEALPGNTTDTEIAWINANPALQPGIGDGLRVQKSETPAQRFSFQASVLSPGRVTFLKDRTTIRSERISFYDMINGVTPNRLKETLRLIYGPEIYDDYERARIVYSYPAPETVDLGRRQNRPLLVAQQGELRVGERYAYWVEVTQTDKGKAFNGDLTVFLKEDLNKLETELRDR